MFRSIIEFISLNFGLLTGFISTHAEQLLEILYIGAGFVSLSVTYFTLKDEEHPSRIPTALFWTLLAAIFMVGEYMPPAIVGMILILMGVLTAIKRVKPGNLKNSTEEFRVENANRIGNKIFIPALAIALGAFGFAQLLSKVTDKGGLLGLGAGAILATILALIITKSSPKNIAYDGARLLDQVGPSSILPQLLAALGSLFAVAGVGEVISGAISSVMPQGNILIGVIAYCVGMAVFTMIMGNAFAAFTVITAGIGIPFVFSQGANPAIAGALAMTAGFCGTLLTPMAANFNVVPAALLETKNKNQVIKTQFPVAITMLIIHIVLMYFWAF